MSLVLVVLQWARDHWCGHPKTSLDQLQYAHHRKDSDLKETAASKPQSEYFIRECREILPQSNDKVGPLT